MKETLGSVIDIKFIKTIAIDIGISTYSLFWTHRQHMTANLRRLSLAQVSFSHHDSRLPSNSYSASLKQCIAMLKLKPGAILADGSPPPSLLLPPCSQPRLLCHQGCQPREKVLFPTFKISRSFLNYLSGLASSASSVLSHLPSLAPVSPTSFLAGSRTHSMNK